MTEPDHSALERLVARLDGSRGALLEALTERTEADFGRALGGSFGEETLGHALAVLAHAERTGVATARSESAAPRELPDQPLPPQVTHDLAGARHQTLTHLESLAADEAETLVTAIVEREAALVLQIGAILNDPAPPADDSGQPSLEFPVI